MIKFIKNILASLDKTGEGYSIRKELAVIAVISAVYIACNKLPEADRIYAVYSLEVFAATCIGLVTIPELIKFLSLKRGTEIEITKTTETVNESVKNAE